MHSRQIMQRDPRSPAAGSRPDQQGHRRHHQRQAQHRIRTHDSEVDHDDNRGDWQPIANDGEGPCITGIAHEDQAAD